MSKNFHDCDLINCLSTYVKVSTKAKANLPRRLEAVPGLSQFLHILGGEPLQGIDFVVEPQVGDPRPAAVHNAVPLLADVVQLEIGLRGAGSRFRDFLEPYTYEVRKSFADFCTHPNFHIKNHATFV